MRRVSGFTLIELMMVVAILGILAVVAIPRYKSYLYRSKTTEAVGFLAEIKSRQESYRADFGQYCPINGDKSGTGFYPTSKSGDRYVWDLTATTGVPGLWRQLGATPPSGQTLFQYSVIAGPPGDANRPNVAGYTGADFWFVSRAQADLDGDGTTMLMEGYSASSSIYVNPPSGWE